MAEGKNKVIFYTDWSVTFQKLSDEEAGKLIKHFCAYINDENPEAPDRITELLFDPMMNTLKRDLKKWEAKSLVNRENGKKGGRPKKTQNNPEKPKRLNKNPEKAVSDSDSVSDIDSDKDRNKTTLTPFESCILSFIEFRKKIRKPITEQGIKLLRGKLEKLAPGAPEIQIQIMEQSILNGWAGVFPIKEEDKKETKTDIPPEPSLSWWKDFRRTTEETQAAAKLWRSNGFEWDRNAQWFKKK